MNPSTRRFLLLSGLLFTTLTLGCGGDDQVQKAEVNGTVTYKSRPLPGGMVVFKTEGGQRAVAAIQSNGTYSLKSPLGKVQVAVVTRPPKREEFNGPNVPPVREVHNPPPASMQPPVKYGRFATSGLSFEVTQDGQKIDIPLKKE